MICDERNSRVTGSNNLPAKTLITPFWVPGRDEIKDARIGVPIGDRAVNWVIGKAVRKEG
jgi:hypothetical protein